MTPIPPFAQQIEEIGQRVEFHRQEGRKAHRAAYRALRTLGRSERARSMFIRAIYAATGDQSQRRRSQLTTLARRLGAIAEGF